MNRNNSILLLVTIVGAFIGFYIYSKNKSEDTTEYDFSNDSESSGVSSNNIYLDENGEYKYPEDILWIEDEDKPFTGTIALNQSDLDNNGFGTTVDTVIDNNPYAPGETPDNICIDTLGTMPVCYADGSFGSGGVKIEEDVFEGTTLDGVLNPSEGQFTAYTSFPMNLNIHNINGFQYWFEILDQNCMNGLPSSGIIYITPIIDQLGVLIEDEIAITAYTGYQFSGPGVVEINIKIYCEDYYGAQTGTEDLTFQLAVGGYN